MNFGTFPLGVVLGGLAALAGILYALQRLRVRHREIEVITTVFWREAVQESQVRVFTRTFRHWWAYVLILLLAGAIWITAADPRPSSGDGARHIVLVDASAAMTVGNRFDDAISRARTLVEDLPRARRSVVLVGGERRCLLLPGEDAALLDQRAADLGPEPTPSMLRRELDDIAALESDERIGVHIVSAEGLSDDDREAFEGALDITEVRLGTSDANTGIAALGVWDAANGRWDEVDVYLEIAGADVEPADLQVTLDGAAANLDIERLGPSRFALRSVAAVGSTLEVALRQGDALSDDDTASLTLPNRAFIDVAFGGGVPDSIRDAVLLDPAVRLATDAPDVLVRTGNDAPLDGVPTLELIDEDGSSAAFTVVTDPEDLEAVAARIVDELALQQIDAAGLATAAGREIELEIEVNETPAPRSIVAWGALFTDRFTFVQSRAYPMFLAGAMRWLAGSPVDVPYVAVGEGIAPILVDDDARRRDGAGTLAAPPRPGAYTLDDGRAVHASLPARAVPATTSSTDDVEGGGGIDLVTLIGVIALILVAIEWVLFQRGRIP